MTMREFTRYLEDKIDKDDDFVRITFYELRVKMNLSEEETNYFLGLAKNKFDNTGYKVYFTNQEYQYKNERKIVGTNELLIAIKNK